MRVGNLNPEIIVTISSDKNTKTCSEKYGQISFKVDHEEVDERNDLGLPTKISSYSAATGQGPYLITEIEYEGYTPTEIKKTYPLMCYDTYIYMVVPEKWVNVPELKIKHGKRLDQ